VSAGTPPLAAPAVGTSLTLQAQKWVQQGYCLGHANSPALPVFLHGALPGETVRAIVVKSTSNHCFARVTEVLSASELRQPANCPAFPVCGGCSFRHMPYEQELQLKLELLDELKFLAACRNAANWQVHHAAPDEYRSRTRVHCHGQHGNLPAAGSDATHSAYPGLPVGFYAIHSRVVVPLPEEGGCRQLAPELNQAIRAECQSSYKSGLPADLSRVRSRATPEKSSIQYELEEPLLIAGQAWHVPTGGFFQANRFLVSKWLEAIRRLLTGSLRQSSDKNGPGPLAPGAASPPRPACIELFCGSGLIGGSLRDLLGEYRGFDNARDGLRAARANFQRRGYSGHFENADLFRQPVGVPTKTGLVLTNPPRAGMNQRQISLITDAKVPRVLYSSCHPMTLNRDLGRFLAQGYAARAVEIFDFFPRTPHLEILILLEKHT
jgi:23S rRNA (uracil1939-C5)-methyltransferase